MRGVPDHSKDQHQNPQPVSSTFTVAIPSAFTPKEPLAENLAALGREVLDLVPRKQRTSLQAYRQAAEDLSAILKVGKVKVKPKNLYYYALRVKWLRDNAGY